MAWQFLGTTPRTYPQYRDDDTGRTLVAFPGGSYDMSPAPSLILPVPPADGLWPEPEPETPADVAEASPDSPDVPPPVVLAPPEDETENEAG